MFYAAAFQSPDKSEIVIAYRGTDADNIVDDRDKLLGLFDVDLDFWGEMIITNLGRVGLSIPGIEFRLPELFYKYIRDNYKFDKMSFTGHSLGGGLAQYASVISSDSEVNKAVTWNGIGIKSFTIISGYEFFDKPQAIIKRLYKEIDGEANKDDVEKEYRNLCDGIIKYFENLGYIEDYQITEQFLKESENGKEIDEEKLDRVLDNFRQKNNYDIFSIIPPKILKDIIDDICSDKDDYGKLDSCKNIKKRLDVKRKFVKEYKESKNYSDSVINYVNPYDLTGNFTDHIGSIYSIKDGGLNTFLNVIPFAPIIAEGFLNIGGRKWANQTAKKLYASGMEKLQNVGKDKGFYGVAFMNQEENEIIIAYRGTDADNIVDDRDKLLGLFDVEPDFLGEMIITNLAGVGMTIPGREIGIGEYEYFIQ